MFWTFIIFTFVIILFMYVAGRLKPRATSLAEKHVVVTGGSSGIGKAIAVLAAQQGANVTILARNKLRLEEAKTEIQQHLQPSRKVQSYSVDLSSNFEDVKKCILEAEEKHGPVFMLVNSAGSSVSRAFQDLDAEDFKVKHLC
ncbi:3-ketodihydrosphingosine reductase-like [Mercenaria mercenaria]|uniref:3-ketodihydrosphingosine reductase-like n=1 Tax=Mercenaria mercenaria TaxID=6596 RepID=UPI00234F6829|nr:3-ketodihydrosphingosine reductase-like [Mercenaria mercenaria]